MALILPLSNGCGVTPQIYPKGALLPNSHRSCQRFSSATPSRLPHGLVCYLCALTMNYTINSLLYHTGLCDKQTVHQDKGVNHHRKPLVATPQHSLCLQCQRH